MANPLTVNDIARVLAKFYEKEPVGMTVEEVAKRVRRIAQLQSDAGGARTVAVQLSREELFTDVLHLIAHSGIGIQTARAICAEALKVFE